MGRNPQWKLLTAHALKRFVTNLFRYFIYLKYLFHKNTLISISLIIWVSPLCVFLTLLSQVTNIRPDAAGKVECKFDCGVGGSIGGDSMLYVHSKLLQPLIGCERSGDCNTGL